MPTLKAIDCPFHPSAIVFVSSRSYLLARKPESIYHFIEKTSSSKDKFTKMTDFATRNSWYKSPIYVSCLVDHNLLKTLITIPFFMMVCSSNWPRLFCLQKLQIALDRSPRQRAAISEMMGAMVWHLAKYSLAWFLSTYSSWQMVMTPGKMEIFHQQATDVGKLRAHNREA